MSSITQVSSQVPFRTGGSPASSVALWFAYQAESLWIFPIEGAFVLPAALLAAFVYYYFLKINYFWLHWVFIA